MNPISIRAWSTAESDINANLNNSTYNFYFTRAYLLVTNLFKWEGLPDSIEKRFIENTLFWYGELAFFNSSKYGLMVAKCNQSNLLNIYDVPISWKCYGNNGFYEDVKNENCAIIRNNNISVPSFNLIDNYCVRISDLIRTCDTNVYQQKRPKIYTCDESQRSVLKNVLMKTQNNEPYIVGNKAIDLNTFNALDNSTPFVAPELYDMAQRYFNEMIGVFGINTANTQKKERLISDEVNANNQLNMFSVDTMLATRQYACDEINKKFGLNVSVELRESSTPNIPKEGVINE